MPNAPTPYIPEFITVHMGLPGSNAADVTVTFADYVKNVASSEVYPTWEPAALRANILAQISFALNRVYTEHYAARGYPYQITATTAYDQKFIPGRNIFQNVSQMVDEIFDDYIRRQGFVEPLSAKFCNGTTSTCDGLSQWGSQSMAEQGRGAMEILRRYYGDDIELVVDAPVQAVTSSYPGTPLRRGDLGPNVTIVQASLNRISQDYPAIGKIKPADGIFGPATEASVKTFQRIFNLTPDGVVGKATWYSIVRVFTGVKRLSELVSEGQTEYFINFQYPDAISQGDRGEKVKQLQYLLSILSEFLPPVPFVPQDGVFGPDTLWAVTSFQRFAGLPETGVVDKTTWDAMYGAFVGADQAVLSNEVLFPPMEGDTFATTTRMTQFPGYELTPGHRDDETEGTS